MLRPGFGDLKAALEGSLFESTLGSFNDQRQSILSRKIDTLLRESADFVTLSLKSVEALEFEREEIKRQVPGEKEIVDDMKSELRLIVSHTAGSVRGTVASQLETHERRLTDDLIRDWEAQFPAWTTGLASMLSGFEQWLELSLSEQLTMISVSDRSSFVGPMNKTRNQVLRALQTFRDRLSDRTMTAFGVPLRTTEAELNIREPAVPDVKVGKVFDRNRELLSALVPVWLVKGVVRSHSCGKIPQVIYTHLSRLTTQWEESINTALFEKEAERRLDELVRTVEHLLANSTSERVPEIQADLGRLTEIRSTLSSKAEMQVTG